MSFNLQNFKNYAGISGGNTADDALIVQIIAPAAGALIAGMLATAKVTPVVATGTIQVQRESGNNREITITPLHRFLTAEGLRYKPDSEVNITIAGDKSEQNISCVAVATGEQYNHASGPLLSSIPVISDATLLSLGFTLGRADYELPDNPQVDLSLFYLTLFYYENRSFLKRELKPEIMKVILGLISKNRDDAKFIPEGASDAV